MDVITVDHQTGRSASVLIGSHRVTVDQPVRDGGEDLGPTPTQLFVASLAACVEYYASRFLVRHDIDPEGLRVECLFEMAHEPPARVASIRLRVLPPPGFPAARRSALAAVVQHCTVHNSIVEAPVVEFDVVERRSAA